MGMNSVSLPVVEEARVSEGTDCNHKIRDLLGNLHWQLAVPLSALSDIAQVQEADLVRVMNGTLELNVLQFSRIAQHFNFSLESFASSRIDLGTLASNLSGNHATIPEQYAIGARSQMRAIRNIANFIRSNHGLAALNVFTRHFQISQTALADPDRPVNAFLVEDSLSLVRSWGHGVDHIVDIGKASTEVARGSVFAKTLALYSNPKLMFEHYIAEHIRLVEGNNIYRISHISDTECIFTSENNPELLDIFSGKSIGGRNRCHYRSGALAAATRYIGLPDAEVTETQCIHLGDRLCEFHVNYQWAEFIWRRQSI